MKEKIESGQQASVDVLEGDKIIAEFMDLQPLEWKHSIDGTDMMIWVDRVTKRSVTDNQHLFYHSSWDWLMPVIEKIETFVIKTNITSNIVAIRVNEDSFYDIVVNFKKENKTKIEGVWQAVIQFITWYNNTQTKKQ